MTEAEIRADERRKIAELIDDFSWTLPFYENKEMNVVTDDVACMVQKQIVAAIRGLA